MMQKEITLDNLFTKEEMKNLAGQKPIFERLVEELKKTAKISEKMPYGFGINGIRYSFYGKEMGDNIRRLELEFYKRANIVGKYN